MSAGLAQPATFRGIGLLPGATNSSAQAVSVDGLKVVGFADTPSTPSFSGGWREAFTWTVSGGTVGLGWLPATPPHTPEYLSMAFAVSGNGAIVAGWLQLGTLPDPDFNGFASRVSADGEGFR